MCRLANFVAIVLQGLFTSCSFSGIYYTKLGICFTCKLGARRYPMCKNLKPMLKSKRVCHAASALDNDLHLKLYTLATALVMDWKDVVMSQAKRCWEHEPYY
jgi:hypothetical protein